MKLPAFEYHVARSVDEAVRLLAEWGDEAMVLAGGQSLIPLLSFRLARPGHLVDVNAIPDLGDIHYGQDGQGLALGATVRQRQAERSVLVQTRAPLMVGALALIGHAAIRNRGTVGGSIAHADPAAELPAVLTALSGEVVAQSVRGTRAIPAGSFSRGFLTTALDDDELLTEIRLPVWPDSTGWAFQEFSRRSGDFGVVGVAAVLGMEAGGRVAHAAVVFSGVGSTAVRAVEAERLLVGEAASPELWEAAAEHAAKGLDPPADLHGSPAYRRQLARVLARRSLQEAYDRAKGAR